MERRFAKIGGALVCATALSACYRSRPAEGGGETGTSSPTPADEPVGKRAAREVRTADIVLPPGYVVEVVAQDLTYPTGITFDDEGKPYVVESGYAYGEDFDNPKLLALERGGVREVASGSNGPWNGVTFHRGDFFIAEGGETDGGRILRVSKDGAVRAIVEGLPSQGDHHTNGPVIGPDGFVYFGQGTVTNSGVVGEDSATFGWLKRHRELHDTPCRDVRVSGAAFESKNPLASQSDEKTKTSAFAPFGTTLDRGTVVPGKVPCNGAVFRVSTDGGAPELVAWGFRNPFGLAFTKDGRLFVTDNAFDMRGSRPIFGAPDLLWEVQRGTWYGWPDFAAGQPVTSDRFKPPGGDSVAPVFEAPPSEPPFPTAQFGVHSSSNGFDFARDPFGYAGEAFVAQFGDLTPGTGKVLGPVGFRVVRVDVEHGIVHEFASNRGKSNGPASLLETGGLERPVAARFDPSGAMLYVVDFGIMTTTEQGPRPRKNTGVIWRIRRG